MRHEAWAARHYARVAHDYFPAMTDLFTVDGIDAWRTRLNTSSRFAEAAAGWNGRLVLVEQRDGATPRRTWIVVADGRCTEARPAHDADELRAEYVLAASPDTWADLTAARTTPTMAALTGKLRLVQGDLVGLLPHARAAAALLAAAAHDEL